MHHREDFEGDPIAKLGELIKDVKYTMLSSIEDGERIVSRPMMTRDVEFDGDVWFFTDDRTAKVDQIERFPQVNLAYFKDKNLQVSVAGRATIERDRAKIEELWSPADNAYFESKDDPHLVLIRVRVETAEYWESPDNFITRTINFVRAMATHDPSKLGEMGQIRLKN